jgi:hypothetical protein
VERRFLGRTLFRGQATSGKSGTTMLSTCRLICEADSGRRSNGLKRRQGQVCRRTVEFSSCVLFCRITFVVTLLSRAEGIHERGLPKICISPEQLAYTSVSFSFSGTDNITIDRMLVH